MTVRGRPGLGRAAEWHWRGLAVQLALVCGITLVVCLLATLVGFTLDIVFFVIMAGVLTVTVWLVRTTIHLAPEVPDQIPVLDVVHLQSRNGDPRVRKLEEFLYGSQPRFNLATPQLRAVVAELVDEKLGAGVDRDRLSPQLVAYLNSSPAQPVDRRRIRMIIKEIAAL